MFRRKKAGALLAMMISGGILMTTFTGCADKPAGTSQAPESSASEDTSRPVSDIAVNIAAGREYFYDGAYMISGDKYVRVLTDGDTETFVTLKPERSADGTDKLLSYTDWYSNTHTMALDSSSAAVCVDFGFLAYAESAKLYLDGFAGGKVSVYSSDDGYNYTSFVGDFDSFEAGVLTAEFGRILVKSLMFVIPADINSGARVSEICVYGERTAEMTLVSAGASYTVEGAASTQFADDGKKLTDGAFYSGEKDTLSGFKGGISDPLTGKTGSIVTLDLGEIKSISEVSFGAYAAGNTVIPGRINVRYSEDGESWSDFGQSFLRSKSGSGTGNLFCVTRNHTVKARYVKLYTYTDGLLVTDEIKVFGSAEAVNEPDYGYVTKINSFADTNVAAYRKVQFNGKSNTGVTNMSFSENAACKNGANTVLVNFDATFGCISGASLFTEGEITNLRMYADGKEIPVSVFRTEAADYTVNWLFADETVSANEVKVAFDAEKASLLQFSVYSGAAQVPYISGGFFQLPTSGALNTSAGHSDYSWYLQLKGMRDLGMRYVVIQYSTHYNAHTTLINGAEITARGYKYTADYGSKDLCKAVLDAAEKLGMKVWLGTVHDSDFTSPSPTGDTSAYEGIVADSRAIISDINNMYGSHPAFGGYYLSDETCDAWLNLRGGVEAARFVYESQSDYIRSIAPDALIMIAPAIWRSGAPDEGAENLYKLVAPKTEGGKPVVDIVAAQDCLGRELTLEVGKEAYRSYLVYALEWSKAVKRAGAEFWHDAEMFEITSTQKRFSDIKQTLALEAPISGNIIVFDIPHYFSPLAMSAANDEYDLYKRLIMREYVRYYSGIKEAAEFSAGIDTSDAAKPLEPVEEKKEETLFTPVPDGIQHNPGILKAASETPFFTAFIKGNTSSVPEYALGYDFDNLYIHVRTNDTTADFGKGQWWSGEDDLLQIWISAEGAPLTDVLTSAHGVRVYLHRSGEESYVQGGEASVTGASVRDVSYTYADGVFTVTVPWSSVGRSVPAAGDGTAVGVLIQYIDGSDSSWAAQSGNTGRNIGAAELYTF